MTVGWMVSVLTTLVCELVGLSLQAWAAARPEVAGLGRFSAFLLFVAVVSGTVALVLQGIVWKVRRVSPPRGISVFALVVSAVPLVVAILR